MDSEFVYNLLYKTINKKKHGKAMNSTSLIEVFNNRDSDPQML